MDTLIPAQTAYQVALQNGNSFEVCLEEMAKAAQEGCDATKDMVAKIGRSSRLGERSRGVIDAGAASCRIILQTMAASAKNLME